MHRRTQQVRIEKQHGLSVSPADVHHVELDSALFADQEPPLSSYQRMHERVSEANAEAALMNQTRSGDRDAFSSLISGHLETLYRLVLQITRNHEDAEDAVHDAILKARKFLPV